MSFLPTLYEYNLYLDVKKKQLHIDKISVFQGNFTEGETQYFQVSKFRGGPSWGP